MKVLLAYDGSSSSQYTLEKSLPFLREQKAEILLLSVIPEVEIPAFPAGGDLQLPWSGVPSDEIQQKLQETGERILATAVQKVEEYGCTYRTKIMYGPPRMTICQVATEEKVDLIIMGSRGLGTVKRLLLGSVSDYVIHHAPCSVLIVRAPIES